MLGEFHCGREMNTLKTEYTIGHHPNHTYHLQFYFLDRYPAERMIKIYAEA